jgi:hypothetical protein
VIAVLTFTARTRGAAAKRRLAVSSVAPVASGYERGWAGSSFIAPEFPQGMPACEARFSLPASAICSGGDC